MIVEGMQVLTVGLNSISHWNDPLVGLNSHLSVDWLVLAQQVSDQDVLGQMAKAWNNFIKTGQVWALLIGVVIGYIFRGFTSF
jgi:hypothetical protein